MAYRTFFTLQIIDNDEPEEIISQFRNESAFAEWSFDDYGEPGQDTSFHIDDAIDEVVTFSKKHPDQLFRLDGEGEESGDIWAAWVKNGKCFFDRPQIVWVEQSGAILQMA